MLFEINNNLQRINLHDSHISEVIYNYNNITLNIDWGFSKNLEENNIKDAIIFDNAILTLIEIQNQVFINLEDISKTINKPKNFENELWLIMTNNYSNKNNTHKLELLITNYKLYLIWTINFMRWSLSFEKLILYKKWLNGEQLL